ncbi:hypothetical protein PCE1_003100 [Barthelona sp. PCE]
MLPSEIKNVGITGLTPQVEPKQPIITGPTPISPEKSERTFIEPPKDSDVNYVKPSTTSAPHSYASFDMVVGGEAPKPIGTVPGAKQEVDNRPVVKKKSTVTNEDPLNSSLPSPVPTEYFTEPEDIRKNQCKSILKPLRHHRDNDADPIHLKPTSKYIYTSEMQRSYSQIPLAVMSSPLAATKYTPTSDIPCLERMPGRCNRCRAFFSPYVVFKLRGTAVICPFCRSSTTLPTHRPVPVSEAGLCTNYDAYPEFNHGTTDYLVDPSFGFDDVPANNPPAHIFVVDCTLHSKSTGCYDAALEAIKRIAENEVVTGFSDDGFVGLMLIDSFVHFITLGTPVPTEVNSSKIFVKPTDSELPIPVGSFLAPWSTARDKLLSVIDVLMRTKRSHVADVGVSKLAVLPAVIYARTALKMLKLPGRIELFYSVLPTIGTGALVERNADVMGTVEETKLFVAQNSLYDRIARQLNDGSNNICVDVYAFPQARRNISTATVGNLARKTGGIVEVFYKIALGSPLLEAAIARIVHLIEIPVVQHVSLRMRCAHQLCVRKVYGEYVGGSGSRGASDEISVPFLRADQQFAFELQYNGSLVSSDSTGLVTPTPIQMAALFSMPNGQRIIRVSTTSLFAVTNDSTVIKSVCIDTVAAYWMKVAACMMQTVHLHQLRTNIQSNTVGMFYHYRSSGAIDHRQRTFIVPMSYRRLVGLITGCRKTDLLREGTSTSVDQRIAAASLFSRALTYDISRSALSFIINSQEPVSGNLIQKDASLLQDWYSDMGRALTLHRGLRASLAENGLFIIEAYQKCVYVIAGKEFDLDCNDTFIYETENLVSGIEVFPADTPNGHRFYYLSDYLSFLRGFELPLVYVRQSDTMFDLNVLPLLFEEDTHTSMGYKNFLLTVHSNVLRRLKAEQAASEQSALAHHYPGVH